MERYSPQDIESKWQKKWEEGKVYKTEARSEEHTSELQSRI